MLSRTASKRKVLSNFREEGFYGCGIHPNFKNVLCMSNFNIMGKNMKTLQRGKEQHCKHFYCGDFLFASCHTKIALASTRSASFCICMYLHTAEHLLQSYRSKKEEKGYYVAISIVFFSLCKDKLIPLLQQEKALPKMCRLLGDSVQSRIHRHWDRQKKKNILHPQIIPPSDVYNSGVVLSAFSRL